MKEIYIDIDVKYESFRNLRLYGLIKQNVLVIRNQFGNFEVWIRRSSSGNVHVRLNFGRDLSVLEHFQVRSLMHDDIYRIGIDNEKYDDIDNGNLNSAGKCRIKESMQKDILAPDDNANGNQCQYTPYFINH